MTPRTDALIALLERLARTQRNFLVPLTDTERQDLRRLAAWLRMQQETT